MYRLYTIMFWFSMMLVAASLVSLAIYGLNFGIDFKGGSVVEFDFKEERPPLDSFRSFLVKAEVAEPAVSYAGDSGIILRTGEMSEDKHQLVLFVLKNNFPDIEEKRFDSVGPVIGQELKKKSITAVVVALLAVITYIAAVFRKLSKVLSSWTMGFAAIVALLHDVIIPVGVFAVFGHFYGIEISAVFVAAVLTILGYSIADTVVVFDRVRENVTRRDSEVRQLSDFAEVVHKSILQTLTRSLNTTFTTLLSLLAIYFFGGESIKYFSLALIIGIFLGAYSSIFVASPLLVWMSKKR